MRGFGYLGFALLLMNLGGVSLRAQTQSQQPLPDAPSAKRTPQQLPTQPPINTAPLPADELPGSSSSADRSADKNARDAEAAEEKREAEEAKKVSDSSNKPKVSPADNPFPEPGTPGNPTPPPDSAPAPDVAPSSPTSRLLPIRLRSGSSRRFG